ncbi:MAG: hypothetical protein KGN37_12530 [Burkholderiales bacterium]|nr:hypothetical protein [Burkholderiales bacterium]
MQIEQLAILFVFVGNAASIVMLAFMLYKISKQTEATHTLLAGGTQDLMDAGKRLRDALKSTDRLVDRLTDMNNRADTSTPPPAPSEVDEQFRKIEAMIQDLSSDRRYEDHGKFLEDIKRLLDSLTGVKPEGLSQWRDDHQNKLETAQVQRNRMATEMEALKGRLDDANRIIQELRRSVRLAEAASQSTDALRASLDQHQQLLARAKEKAQQAEARCATLSREIELLEAEAGRGDGKSDGPSTSALRRQLDEVTRERDGMKNQLDQLRDMMQRTLVEKEFIEEKLLDLDAAAYSSRASTTAPDSQLPQG